MSDQPSPPQPRGRGGAGLSDEASPPPFTKPRLDERWEQVARVFEAALERPAEERRAFLESRLAGDPTLRAEIESLLEADAEASGFLEIPAAGARAELWQPRPAVRAGARIGCYRILRPIGRGGMGTVYLADRADEEYRQQVAIKLANVALVPRGDPAIAQGLLRSFRGERQLLANLEHPNIARLLDGGTTGDGLPYLVMEYVEGIAVDDYCQRRALSTAERLELFGSVCAAVQYAHRHLVVHRDIKPKNILITGDGVPKLLDFGIAKLLEPDAAVGSEVTRQGLRPLTPGYASPEQLRGRRITTATDIYSLGVLLYRLLTGRPPRVFRSLAPPEIERVLAQVPPRLDLDRDLDGIVLKALDEQPERRYASVEQLAADLRRYAAGLPVLARRHTPAYRAAKFLRRHRLAVAIAAAVAALLLGLALERERQAGRLAREHHRARIEAAKARELSTFLVDLLQDSDPWQTPGREVTVREVLDRGSEEIRRRLDDEPELRGMLLDTMGSIYLNLALYDKAQPLLEEGLAERRRALPGEHPDVATSLGHLGAQRRFKSDYDQAEAYSRQALAIRRRALRPEDPLLADSLHQLGLVLLLKAEYDETERTHREALALRRRVLGEDHVDVAASQDQLANLYTEIGRFEAAEDLYRRALETKRRQLGDEHPEVAVTLGHLASLLRRKGDLGRAEEMFRRVLAVRRSIFDDLHPQVGRTMNNLAAVLLEKGDHLQAEALYRQVLGSARRVLGEDHRDVAVVHNSLGKVMQVKGDFAAAESHYRRSLEIVRRVLPAGHPGAAYPLQHLGSLRIQAGAPERAEPLLRRALELRARALPAGHPAIAESRGLLGGCLLRLGRFEEAEELLVESYRALAAAGVGGPRVEAAGERLAALYQARGQPERAAEVRGADGREGPPPP